MAKPSKTKSGSWRVQVYMGIGPDGKGVHFKATVSSYKEALQLIAIKELERQSNNAARAVNNITVEKAISDYIGSVDAVLSPQTIIGYEQLARNAYTPINSIKVSMLSDVMIQKCVNWYAETHKPKSVKNAFGLLKRALWFAGKNDIGAISLPRVFRADIVVPTDEQIVKLVKQATHLEMKQAILIAALAGPRRSEIAALRWEDIDFDKSTITIKTAIVKKKDGSLIRKDPKSSTSKRTILVGKEIMDGFKTLKESGAAIPINLTPNAITRRFERICEKANIKGISFHGLRHYQASIMLAEGIPDKYAMERMGHSSTNMLRNVYQHTMTDSQLSFSNRLNQNISDRFQKALSATAEEEADVSGE